MGAGGKYILTLLGFMDLPGSQIQFCNITYTLIEYKVLPHIYISLQLIMGRWNLYMRLMKLSRII